MLGNLSKVLIKAPKFFNNQKKSLPKIPEENTLDPFYQIKYIKNKENSINNYYFKEKDFWRKNSRLDMNFNNNKRLSYKISISPKDTNLEYSKENENNVDNKDINYFNKKRKYSNLSINNPIRTIKGEKNLNIYKQIFLLNKNNIKDIESSLDTEANKTIDKDRKFLYISSNKPKKSKTIILKRYNTEENHNFNEDKKEFKNKEYKFLKNIKTFKSQESLFQDNLDKKLVSLILLKPQIKEQLKSINRSMVGQRDYYVYQQSGKLNSPNPFYESMKKKEEMKKYIKSIKNKKELGNSFS